jgi:hypothetical protein
VTDDVLYVTAIITIFFPFYLFPFLYIFTYRRFTFVHGHLFLFLEIIVFIFHKEIFLSLPIMVAERGS